MLVSHCGWEELPYLWCLNYWKMHLPVKPLKLGTFTHHKNKKAPFINKPSVS